MIFGSRFIGDVLAGRITQTRRPLGEPQREYKPGRSYAVQNEKQIQRARFVVLGVREELLDDATQEDAHREGFANREDLFTFWREKYHDGPLNRVPVVVVQFVLDRTHRPRLLHRDSSRGYTERSHEALHDEPEAVDEASLQRFGDEARDDALKERRKAARDAVDRLPRLVKGAAETGIDIDRQLQAIKRHVEVIERKKGRAA